MPLEDLKKVRQLDSKCPGHPVGHLLARGHARTSGASMIAEYVGESSKLDEPLARTLYLMCK